MPYQILFAFLLLGFNPDIESKVRETTLFLVEEYQLAEGDRDTSLVFSLSVGAPEHIRYRTLSNLMEVQVLRLLYAELGSDEVDFSVGYFQMKPSFIEELERRLARDGDLGIQYSDLISFSSKDLPDTRSQRIDRILDKAYSSRYLQAFTDLSIKEYASALEGLSIHNQLIFLSTAYNMGFGHTANEIKQYQKTQNFPHGSRYKGEQYAFGHLSVRIYDQMNKLLCKSNR